MSAGTIIDGALSAESWIRKAVVEGGFTPGLVGLADAKAEVGSGPGGPRGLLPEGSHGSVRALSGIRLFTS